MSRPPYRITSRPQLDLVECFSAVLSGELKIDLLDHETAMNDAADNVPILKLYSGWPSCIPEGEVHQYNYRDLDFYTA